MNELVEKEQNTTLTTPDTLLQMAVQQGADLDKLEKLMDLKARYEADEARKAYTRAIADFKANPPKIFKDKHNSQYGSMYTSIEGLVNSVIPALSKYGLSHRWDIQQRDGGVTVACVLTHVMGHSENVCMSAPPDDSGKKNPIQQIKSTITYLKGATLEAITGLASETFNQSDDGNGASIENVSDEQIANLEALISEVGTTKEAFSKVCKVDYLDNLPASKYDGAVRRLEPKRKDNAGA